MFKVVSSINFSIPKDVHCLLKRGDNLATHATHSSKALGHDLAGFTIGLNFFPRSILVVDHNGKGKGGGELDTSPIEYSILDPSKGEKDKEIL